MKKIIKSAIFWTIVLIFGLILLNSQGLLKKPKNYLYSLVSPSQKSSSQIAYKISNFFYLIKNIKNLNDQNSDLKEKNLLLEGQIAQLKEIEKENEFLRKQTGLSSPAAKKLILANIIGKQPTNLGEYVFINKGQKDGVEAEAAVILPGDILVGRVKEVWSSMAKILLITDSNSLVSAIVQQTRIQGVVKGQSLPQELTLDLVLPSESLEKDQAVVSSALNDVFPQGLLIGQVEQVISSDPQIFQKAKVKPAADFNKLEKLFVIIR